MSYDAGDIEADLVLNRTPFTTGLAAARRQAARFERDAIEPKVEVQGLGEAHTELARLRRELEGMEGDAHVDLDTAPARAKLAALQAQLERLEADDVEIDVDVRRGIDDHIAAVVASIADLRGETRRTRTETSLFARALSGLARVLVPIPLSRFADGLEGARERMNDARIQLGFFSLSLTSLLRVIGAGIPMVVSLGAALGALVASLAMATAGVGALAIAFSATLVPAVALGIGVFRRFEAQSKKAGTAAHALKREMGDFGQVFDRTMASGADAVLRGMAGGLRLLTPMVRSLRGEFTNFGRVVGDAFRKLGAEFASPAWREFFSFLTNAAARITPILTDTFISFARVLRDIAQAAMPSLIDGLRSFQDAMAGLAGRTSNIDALRSGIEGLVSHLRSWIELAHQGGRVMVNFFKAAAPAGQEMVQWLTEGAKRMADFLGSASGQNAVQDFFAATMPLAKELMGVIGQLAEAMIRWSELTAPVLTPIVDILGKILDAANKVLEVLGKLPGPLNEIAGALLLFGGGSLIKGAFGLLGRALGALPGLAGRAATALGSRLLPLIGRLGPMLLRFAGPLGAIAAGIYTFTENIDRADDVAKSFSNVITLAFQNVRDTVAGAQIGVETFASGLVTAASRGVTGMRNMAQGVGAAMQSVGDAAALAVGVLPGELRKIGQKAAQALAQGIKGAGNAAADAAKAIAQNAVQGARSLSNSFRSVGRTLTNAMAAGQRSARGAVSGAARAVGQAGVQAANSLRGAFTGAGRNQGNAMAQGIRSSAGAVAGAVRGIGQAAASAAASLAGSFQSAGAAMGNALAAGIRSAIGGVTAAAQAIAQAARNQMPGSEPKDPSSPLRNLGAAGRATVENYVKGLDAALAAKAMRRTLGPARREMERPVGMRAESESILAALEGLSLGPNINVQPLAVMPDGRTLSIIGGLATAGQARQAHRIGSRKTVHG